MRIMYRLVDIDEGKSKMARLDRGGVHTVYRIEEGGMTIRLTTRKRGDEIDACAEPGEQTGRVAMVSGRLRFVGVVRNVTPERGE